MDKNKFNFQYCQKIVVFSKDYKKVLLCKRKGENDYDGVYSFIGGKMENSDKDILTGLKREKNEEVGKNFKIKIYPKFSINLLFHKKSGDYMILPHYLAIYMKGNIKLNQEYSDYKWIDKKNLDSFKPIIANIPSTVKQLLKLRKIITNKDFIII